MITIPKVLVNIIFDHFHSATFIQKDISKNNSAGYLIPDGALWLFRYRQYRHINSLAEITPNTPKFIQQMCPIVPKVWNIVKILYLVSVVLSPR